MATGIVAALLLVLALSCRYSPAPTAPPSRPYLLVRSTRSDASFGKLQLVPLSAPNGPAYEAPLSCDRAAFAGTRGVCLSVEGTEAPAHYADVFDEGFTRVHRVPLAGAPSRIGVARDRPVAAISVSEHTHDDPATDFVPRTILVDTQTGRVVADLQEFRFTGWSPSANEHPAVWGVTFAPDGDRFFATLETSGTQYLVEGHLSARSGRIVRPGVESPALSPDGNRIVYKERPHVGDPAKLHVYDLRTGADAALTAESRSIEDQVVWLDDDRILYHVTGANGSDVWVLRVDGADAPRVLRSHAYAPWVVR